MGNRNDGGPAFPACNEANVNETMGMTLRDYFAGQALAGMLATDVPGCITRADVAAEAYLQADAMLAARTSGSVSHGE